MNETALTSIKWISILPEGYMLVSLLVMLLYGVFHKTKSDINSQIKFLDKYFFIGVMLVVLGLVLVCSISYISIIGFNSLIAIDSFSSTFKIILFISVILILLGSKEYLFNNIIFNYEYIVVLLFSFLGLSLLISANDFLMVFVAMEFASLPFYLLAINGRYSVTNNQAILKYFILSLVATGMFLYGVSFVYGYTGSTSFSDIKTFLFNNSENNLLLDFAMLMIIISLAFKLSLAPFHMWVIDVYSGLNYTLTLILNTVFKLAFAFVLVKILWLPFYAMLNNWWYIIYALSIASIIIGYIGAIFQRNIIKIIAYSGVVQMGFLAINILVKNNLSVVSLSLFILIYIIANIGIFTILMQLYNNGKKVNTIDDLVGIYKQHPYYSFMLSMFFMSLAGIPPLAGFIGKLFVIYLAIVNKYYVLAIIAVIASLIGMFYYIRIVKYIYSASNVDDNSKQLEKRAEIFSFAHVVLLICIVFTTGLILLLKPITALISQVNLF
ncbi:NADH-quinone oxidoreductase subunit N [Rickettsiales bacterium LUAb2]